MPNKLPTWAITVIIIAVVICAIFLLLQYKKKTENQINSINDKLNILRFRLWQKVRIQYELDCKVEKSILLTKIAAFIIGLIIYYVFVILMPMSPEIRMVIDVFPVFIAVFKIRMFSLGNIENTFRNYRIQYVFSEYTNLRLDIQNIKTEIKQLESVRQNLVDSIR